MLSASLIQLEYASKHWKSTFSYYACRALGIILVMMYHMKGASARSAWMMIGMFFTLSGFLITSLTFQTFEKRGAVSLRVFWFEV